MAKKKESSSSSVVEKVESKSKSLETSVPKVEGVAPKPEINSPVSNPMIYRRETLMQMSEILAYGLNGYFLDAILKEKYYTLEQAKKCIEEVV